MKKKLKPPIYKSTSFNLSGRLLYEIQKSGYNFFVYILECVDGSFYTGLTNDLDARLYEHSNGIVENCYTYTRRPVALRYFELYHEINEAIFRENQIKGWSRVKKLALINSDIEELKKLAKLKKGLEK